MAYIKLKHLALLLKVLVNSTCSIAQFKYQIELELIS